MADARFVRIEGMDKPCLLVCEDKKLPDEIVVELEQETIKLVDALHSEENTERES